MKSKEYEVEIGDKKINVIFSDLAEQANGSVILKSQGTVVMATAVISKSNKNNPGYFNLTVEYLEKFYAAGKILGGQFNKREGRPSDRVHPDLPSHPSRHGDRVGRGRGLPRAQAGDGGCHRLRDRLRTRCDAAHL